MPRRHGDDKELVSAHLAIAAKSSFAQLAYVGMPPFAPATAKPIAWPRCHLARSGQVLQLKLSFPQHAQAA